MSCRYCKELGLHIEPKPLVWGELNARIVQISQAPSRSASKCGRPFSKSEYEPDASGAKLIEWYAIPREVFYDPEIFYITGMAHCYPGKGKGGDEAPPLICARKWLREELSFLNPKLHILIGRHAARFLFPGESFSELVFRNMKFRGIQTFVLPHPSPANRKWFKGNPEFERERLQDVRAIVHEAIQK